MTVDDIYQFCLTLIRKNQSGSINPIEFARYWNAEQSAYMDDMLGHFQRNTNAKTGLNTGLVQNQPNITKLTPFIKPGTITITAGNGDKPADFKYELLLQINGYGVMHINHNQIPSVSHSVIDTPSVADNEYFCVEYEDYYSFLPTTPSTATISYISKPVEVLWNYTFDGSGRQVYNPTGSSQPQWQNSDCREITKRMLKSIGVSLAAKDFEGFGDSVINTAN